MASVKKAPARKTAPARKSKTTRATTKKTTAPAIGPKTARKKTIAKAAPGAEAPAWSTLHIFGYGETQLIGGKTNGKVRNAELKSLKGLFTALARKQQKGTTISLDDTHALTVFHGAFADFRPRPGGRNKGQRIPWADVSASAVYKVADEVMAKITEAKAEQTPKTKKSIK